MKKPVKFMVTAFRDGFQSAFGARVFTQDFLPAVEAAVHAGMNHFEAGGGARFQSLYFYCNEDAFDMMDQFRATAGKKADLQTLARGVNVVGLDSQPRDVIKMHAQLFKKHGISTIRNFDALNDVNNLIYSGQCIADAGLRHEVVVTMMELPPGCEGAHTAEFYIDTLRKILDAGIPYDSVCFKDASGTSAPQKVYDTIKEARKLLGKDMNIVFHSHETAGVSILQYKLALEAGASQIDLSLAPTSGGTCQPDVITMWHALRGTEFDLGIDIDKVIEAEKVYKECMADYFVPPESTAVEPLIPFAPMPGGALTANTQMMRDNGIMDRYEDVVHNMGEVVRRGGFGTSVTPVSQFYFQQAFNNTMLGPWKKIAEGYGKMVLGYFGKTPVEPDPEIVKLCQEQLGLEPTTDLVVDINDRDPSKGVVPAKRMLEEAKLPLSDENIFIAATCKEKGIAYLKGEAKTGVRKIDKAAASSSGGDSNGDAFTVTVNNKKFSVKFDGDKAVVNGTSYNYNVREGIEDSKATLNASAKSHFYVEAPMPGLVLRISVSPGDEVKEGDLLLVLEAMKMETEIHAPVTGIVDSIPVAQGDQKKAGEVLVVINQ
ncbi:MAG: biotin attachment protein [Spirochaetales bacterium]|nr:biotin attachment protein [Spirochaetales bacterium]